MVAGIRPRSARATASNGPKGRLQSCEKKGSANPMRARSCELATFPVPTDFIIPVGACGRATSRIWGRVVRCDLSAKAATFDRSSIATQHLELRLVTVAAEPDIELVCSNTKIEHRQVRQPLRQPRIDAQLSSRCIRHEPQHGLQQRKDRACRPSLRYVGSKVLDGETSFVALDRRIELR